MTPTENTLNNAIVFFCCFGKILNALDAYGFVIEGFTLILCFGV